MYHHKFSRKFLLNILIFLIFCEIGTFVFFLNRYLPTLSRNVSGTISSDSKKIHIVLLGNSENASFLNQVYNGALPEGIRNNAAIELYVPASKAEDKPLQTLFNYAEFVNADGIIAFIPEEVDSLTAPVRSDGSDIPVVTIGTNNPSIRQVSYVGNNFSETGKILGQEAVALFNDKDRILVVSSRTDNSSNQSVLKNSLIQKLRFNQIYDYEIFDDDVDSNSFALKKLLFEAKKTKDSFIIVCLTDDDTILTSQLLSDFDMTNRGKIIGFGENEITDQYLKNGIITELCSMDMEQIGSIAVTELFEFINFGSANRIVSVDLKIRNGKSKKGGI